MRKPALTIVAALLSACSSSGAKGSHDSGADDAGQDRGIADAGPFTLPVYTSGALELDDAGCPPLPAQPDLFDKILALADAGLTRCNLTYPSGWHSFFALPDGGGGIDDEFVLPYYNRLHDHPLLVPSFATNLTEDLDSAGQSAHPVSETLAALAARQGVSLTVSDPTATWAPQAGDPEPLADALASLGAANPDAGWSAVTAGIPMALQSAAATLLNGLAQAPAVQAAYLANLPAGFDQKIAGLPLLINQGGIGNQLAPNVDDPTVYSNLEATDITPFAMYATQLALAVENLNLPSFAGAMGFSLHVSTPLGAVIIDDAVARTYEPTDDDLGGNILLLIKTGGDDTYRIPVGANQYTRNLSTGAITYAPAALAIDLGGKDTYAYDIVHDRDDTGNRLPSDSAGRAHPFNTPKNGNGPVSLSTTPREGAGTLGVGLLFDYGTDDDSYQSLRMSQGFGLGGVGVLFDQGGNDAYAGENMVQGAAVFGIGLLLDLAGNDVHTTYTQSQGFGFTRGLGALVDLAGDDMYLADVGDPAQGGDPLYYTPQLPGVGNSSMCQGAGFGLNDFNGRGMSGGLGILRDLAGNDVYQGSVFAQATGYYLGFGMLIDTAGDDQYDALWYTQGSAAHYAMSFFYDGSGDDLYEQHFIPKATGPNCGHDFSVGIHIDNGGNDVYSGAGLCLGESNDLGTGIFINNGGNDTFNGTPQCFGFTTDGDYKDTSGNPVNYYAYGIFVKAGGVGTYTGGNDPALDHSNSVAIQQGVPPLNYGLFVDQSDAGPVSLP